jgi:predicted signal transduction protein with EAL and GGDEF domain
VILDDPIGREDAERVGMSLIEMLGEPFEMGNRTLQIGASIGIALFPEDAADGEGLCIAADLRMYEFKHKSGHFDGLARLPASALPPRKEDESRSRQVG